MMFTLIPRNGGLVKIIIIIVVALLVLSYFGFNLRSTVESPTTQSNFSYAKDLVIQGWDFLVDKIWIPYLKTPVTYFWDNIFLKYIWGPAVDNLQRIASGQPNTISLQAPKLPQFTPSGQTVQPTQ